MSVAPIVRAAPPAHEAPNPPRPENEAREPGLREDFERRLDAIGSRRHERLQGGIEPLETGAAAASVSMLSSSARAESVAAVSAAPMSLNEFSAALERLHAPVAVPGVPSQWEFTLDSRHAPLQAVRVTESAAGGWDVALHAALPTERPLLAARLERLRTRFADRGVAVTHLRVDESDV